MLTYELDSKSSSSLYEQLYRSIRSDIEAARLDAGSKLPSKRSLAQHLGVSVITVESAYRQLAAEGYIEAQERRGYFVSELPAVQAQASPGQESLTTPETPLSSAQECISSAGALPIQATPLLADFSGNDRSGNLFPFRIWAKTVRRTLNEASKGMLLRTSHDNRGSEELRLAIAKHLASFRGLDVSPDQIVIGAGAQDLYGVLVQLLGRDRTFAVEDPGYPALRTHYELSGAQVAGIPVDEKGLDVAALRASDASIAHCTPAHQFPTGSVMSAVRRRELIDWAHELDDSSNEKASLKRYLIEDDYDSEFRMRGRPIPPLYTQDPYGSVIYLNTFTRSLGSVFRIAYMVLPPQLLTEFSKRFAARSCMVGALEQLELARFITSGDYERHVNRQRTIYRRLQDSLVVELTASDAGRYLSFTGVGSGLHFLMEVNLPEGAESATQFEIACLERGIRLMNIDKYRAIPNSSTSSKHNTATADGSRVLATSPCTTSADATSSSTAYASCPTTTYVMNVSGLDGTRTNEIAAALSNALLQKQAARMRPES